MEAVLTTFGIDWRLLLVNAVNFGLLMLALWYFLYEPVARMLEERRQKVAKGVADAQAAERALGEMAAERSATLARAGKEADEILSSARASGAKKERDLIDRAQASAEAALKEAELQARELKARAVAESKQEVAKLIVLGMEKIAK